MLHSRQQILYTPVSEKEFVFLELFLNICFIPKWFSFFFLWRQLWDFEVNIKVFFYRIHIWANLVIFIIRYMFIDFDGFRFYTMTERFKILLSLKIHFTY